MNPKINYKNIIYKQKITSKYDLPVLSDLIKNMDCLVKKSFFLNYCHLSNMRLRLKIQNIISYYINKY